MITVRFVSVISKSVPDMMMMGTVSVANVKAGVVTLLMITVIMDVNK
jgi:hypothetical protein